MCLIVFAWQPGANPALLACANRDEYYARPSVAAGSWPDHPQIYAGRDEQEGGSWLGITTGALPRFAALTNVRLPAEQTWQRESRGFLVRDYLTSTLSTTQFIENLRVGVDRHRGFNLVVGDARQLIWYSNRASVHPLNGQPLPAGIYGLSNAALDTPWTKLLRAKTAFSDLQARGAADEAYFELLADATIAADADLPATGIPLEWERALSAICIGTPTYGTRCSTLVRLGADRASLVERTRR